MSAYVGLAVAVIGAALQATILPAYPLLGVHLDLVPVAVLGWAALRRYEQGLVWAVLGGVAIDFFSALPFGTSVVALALAAVVAAAIAGSLRTIHPFLIALALPVALLTYYLVSTVVMALGGWAVSWLDVYRGVVGPAVLIDSAIGLFLLAQLAWLSRTLTPDPWAPQ